MKAAITILVPVYNMGKYLRTCFDSILAQTYTDFELLIINDGSTDNSREICEEYRLKDNRVRVIHTDNQGQDMARNTGLMNVHTDYIAMIDADDCVNCHYLEILMATMKKTDADMVSGLALNFENDDEINYMEDMSFSDEDITFFSPEERLEQLCKHYDTSIPVPHKLYKAKVFEGVSYPPVRVNIDEWTIHHLILNCRKIAVVNVRLYYYRYSPEGMTRNFSTKKISGVNAQIDRIDTLKKNDYEELVPYVYGKLYEKADEFFWNCKKSGVELPQEFSELKPEIRKAFDIAIKNRKDLYSRKEMFTKKMLGYNFTLYKLLSDIFNMEA